MDTDPEQTPPIRFYVVDPQGIPLIKKKNTTYHPDSVKLFYQDDLLRLDTLYDNNLDSYIFEAWGFEYRIKETDLQLLVKLDHTHQDTLDITFRFTNEGCAPYFVPTTYSFNQNRIYPDLSEYRALKLVIKPD